VIIFPKSYLKRIAKRVQSRKNKNLMVLNTSRIISAGKDIRIEKIVGLSDS